MPARQSGATLRLVQNDQAGDSCLKTKTPLLKDAHKFGPSLWYHLAGLE